MLVLNAYLHPQDPQDPVFDLMCVPSVMQRKCKASKMAGAGLLLSPLPVVEDGSMGQRLCNTLNLRSQSRVDALSARRVTTTTSGRNASMFNFLLIANMQKHNSAREPGLHFAASPFDAVRPSMS